MIPIWSLLTINLTSLIDNSSNVVGYPTDLQLRSATVAGSLAVAMLCVSILWVIHSSLFRTVGYMAAWIGAFTSQKKEAATSNPVNPKNFMCRLWVLAAGDGHPTWRTPVGQAMGLYLVVLSWGVSIVSQIYLNLTCYDDLVLLRMMMWFPPSLLTLVVIINQSVIFAKSTRCSTPDIIFPGQIWKETQEFYTKAVIIYRLGKKGMDVTVDDEYNYRKHRGKRTDKALATFVIVFEAIFFVVAYIGFIFFKAFHWLARKILLPDGTPTAAREGACYGWQGCQYCSGCMASWSPYYGDCEAKRREIAFKILCDHCGEKSSLRYDPSPRDGAAITDEVRRLLQAEHLAKIDLPLLLDNIHPSGLSYILEQLVALPSFNCALTSNDDQVLLTSSSPRDQELKTIRISKGTSLVPSRSANKVPQPEDAVSLQLLPTPRSSTVELGPDPTLIDDKSNATSEPEIPEQLSLQPSDPELASRLRRRTSSKWVRGDESLVE